MYNARTHPARAPGCGGRRIEARARGGRETDASRGKFAAALVNQLATYLDARMGLKRPLKPKAR